MDKHHGSTLGSLFDELGERHEVEALAFKKTLTVQTEKQMKTIEFLKSYPDPTTAFAALAERYKIRAVADTEFPNLYSLKYSQTESPMGERIVQECRGLILDTSWGQFTVVARPFDKFFNVEEGHAAKLDWSSAKVYEKRDGSLIVVYFYDGQWRFASSGRVQADPMLQEVITKSGLRDAVEHTLTPGCADSTYLFEVTSPINRVIIPYSEPEFRLLAVRQTLSGLYYPNNLLHLMGFPVVREFKLASEADCRKSFSTFSPLSMEGYVACDDHGNRVKIKHPGYVALHHRKESPYASVEIVLAGEIDEVVASFPELREDLEKTQARFNALVAEANEAYQAIKHLTIRKDYCLAAQKSRFAKHLINLYLGRYPSMEANFRACDARHIASLMGGL